MFAGFIVAAPSKVRLDDGSPIAQPALKYHGDVLIAAQKLVLDLFAAGMSLKRLQSEKPEGCPGVKTILRWRAKDAAFAAAFVEAQKAGGTAPIAVDDEAIKREFIAFIQKGGTRDQWMRRRSAQSPGFASVQRLLRNDPHFRRQYEQAVRDRGVAATRRDWWASGARHLSRLYAQIVQCARCGDSVDTFLGGHGRNYSALRSYLSARPSLDLLYRQAIILRAEGDVIPGELEFLMERARRAVHKVNSAEEKAFRKQIDQLALDIAKRLDRQERAALKRAKTTRPKASESDHKHKAGLLRDEIYAAAHHAISRYRYLEDDDRSDIAMDVVIAVLESGGELASLPEIVAQMVGKHNRAFRSRNVMSLDAEMFDDSNVTLLDRISADEYSYAD